MSQDLIIINPLTSGYILIPNNVINRMLKFTQHRASSKEGGGLLLGYRRGPHFEVVDITTPLSGDIRKRTYFERCDSGHECYIYDKWVKSNRMVDYLGEWHTHPEVHPKPSQLDKSEWLELLRLRDSSLFFLILGINGLWGGVGRKKRIKCCEFLNEI